VQNGEVQRHSNQLQGLGTVVETSHRILWMHSR
jgi:hypothetical protein